MGRKGVDTVQLISVSLRNLFQGDCLCSSHTICCFEWKCPV